MKRNKFLDKVIYISFFLQLVITGFVNAQNATVKNDAQEKVFLHLLQDLYLSGMELRYSAFVIDPETQRLSASSNILNVQLINANNKKVLRQKLVLKKGLAGGVLSLPNNLPSGVYLLLAYTENSTNFNHRYSFKQKVRIVNPDQEILELQPTDFNIKFFPEGGQIIGGHMNKVAFESNKDNWEGVILSSEDDTVANIQPYRMNFGQFSLWAKDNLNYKARIKSQKGVNEYPLPKVKNNTITSRLVSIESDTLSLIVSIGKDYVGNELGMLVYHNSEIILGAKQAVIGKRLIFNIPKALLNNGLNTFFIYNEDQAILSERNFYKSRDNKYVDRIKLNKTILESNNDVILPLNTLDRNLEKANVSIGIKNLYFFDSLEVNNMSLYFDMFSELNVLEPKLIINELKQDFQFTDIYLKTKSIGSKKLFELYDENQKDRFLTSNSKDFFIITGKVVDLNYNEPIIDSVIYCSVIGQVPQFFASKTDDEGRFYFQIRSFSGQSDILIKVANIDESQANLEYQINRRQIDINELGFSTQHYFDDTKLKRYIDYRQQDKIINRVYSPSKVQDNDLQKKFQTSGFFPNYADSKALREYEYLEDFNQLSRELLPGLTIKNSGNSEKIYLREIDDSGKNSFIGRFDKEPLFLIDGLPIFNNEMVLDLSPAKIDVISLINKRYYVNGVFLDGVLEIATQDGEYYKQNKTNHHWFAMQGFYEPKKGNNYDKFDDKSEKDKIPDFRDLLYWESNFKLGNKEPNDLQFSTSDDVGEYLFELNGLDGNGKVVYYRETIKVKK